MAPNTLTLGLGLASAASCASMSSDLAGMSPRSTESASSLSLFVRASSVSDGGTRRPARIHVAALSWVLHVLASCAVTTYDLLMRCIMPSWYLLDLQYFPTSADYLHAKADRKTRRYVESASNKFVSALVTGQISLAHKSSLSEEDFAFARRVLCGKHGKPVALFLAWRMFMTLLAAAPYYTSFSTVVDGATGAVLALFVEFRQGTAVHHFITALVDHEASKAYGIYVAKYDQMISTCTQDGVCMLRMGPTTDTLKAGMGGVRLPLFVVGSPVWARLRGRCSVVAFGLFTSVGLFAYLWLTQWQMDASGMGRLTLGEFGLLYACCMAFVKTLPLWSIGWRKVLAQPRKYLLQTSFYAQGVIMGGLLFIALAAYNRQVSPLQLLDGICLFALVGDAVGRVGCHWYGCCHGRPLTRLFTASSTAPRVPPAPRTAAAGLPAPTAVGAPGLTDSIKARLFAPERRLTVADVAADGAVLRAPWDGLLLPRTAGVAGSGSVGGSSPAPSSVSSDMSEPTAAVTLTAAAGPKRAPPGLSGKLGDAVVVTHGTKTGAEAGLQSPAPFHPLSLVYTDRDSSVLRLHPELRLQPLLPTQLLQALFATVCQVAVLTWLAYHPTVKTGVVGCVVLSAYSVGRAAFFYLREDECFKSNRSYTTFYVAVGTLIGCSVLGVFTHCCSPSTTTFALTWRPLARDVWAYTWVAALTAAVNFLVQGLHHHQHVGRFPDPAALLAPLAVRFPWAADVAPRGAASGDGPGLGGSPAGRRSQAGTEGLRRRQVLSSWGEQ